MKIVHIFPVVKFGGAPIVVLNLLITDKNNEHIVISKSDDTQLLNSFENNAKKYYDVSTLSVSFKSIFQILNIINDEKPQIIHAHGKGGAFYSFIISIFLFKPSKIIYTFHGFNNKFSGLRSFIYILFEKLFSIFVDRYVAVSDTEKKKVIASNIFNEKKVCLIPNGVIVEKKQLEIEKQNLLNKYDFNIVTLSRISPQKDLETMLYAFKKIIDNTKKNIGLHILGGHILSDENYVSKVFSLCESLNLSSNVEFWGDVPFASSYLHNFNIYWTTALWEGLPTAIIETMMQKVPVIATNCVGNIDLVNENTGILTPMKDPAEISKIFIEYFQNNYHISLVENAFYFVNNNFTAEVYTNNILGLYQEVLNENITIR